MVIAHRGGWRHDEEGQALENSLPNLEKAVRCGYDAFETDVNLTADGHLVIMHDPTIDRTTTGTGRVTQKTLAELKQLRLEYPSGEVSEDTVPTFSEMLTRGKDRILFKLDLKCGIDCLERVLDELDATGTMRQVMIRLRWPEIDPDEVERIVSSSPKYADAILLFRVDSPDEASEAIARFQPAMVEVANPEHELGPEILEMIRRIHESGARVEMHEWGEPPDMQPLIDAGVRAFHSDRPQAMIWYLRKTGQHS
jgi:glycerophosphoryl diester phosphodiesterase